MILIVNEIFYSLQGESSFAGQPCVFIRLTGCNLRCSYCDTQYAYHTGKAMEINRIIDEISQYKCPLVEVTGGEPLIQKNTPDLILSLIENGFQVLLETNGSQDINLVDDRCVKVVDIKCPSSNEAGHNNFKNLKRLTSLDEVKFVLSNKEDYEYAKEVIERPQFSELQRNKVHFSPVFGQLEYKKLAKWILEDHLRVKLHIQLHKIIWGQDTKV